jgi:hypothetical protein
MTPAENVLGRHDILLSPAYAGWTSLRATNPRLKAGGYGLRRATHVTHPEG